MLFNELCRIQPSGFSISGHLTREMVGLSLYGDQFLLVCTTSSHALGKLCSYKTSSAYHNAPYTYTYTRTLHVSTYALEIPERFILLVNIYNHSRFVDHSLLESIIDHPSRSRISFLYFLVLFLPLYRYYTSLFFLHILLAFWHN